MSSGDQKQRRKKPVQKRGQTGSPVMKSIRPAPKSPDVTKEEVALALGLMKQFDVAPEDLKKAMRKNPIGTVNTIKLALHNKQLTKHQAKDVAHWEKQAKHMAATAALEKEVKDKEMAKWRDRIAHSRDTPASAQSGPIQHKVPTISFFTLTTFESAKKGVSMDEATQRGALTRSVTMPAVAVPLAPYAIATVGLGAGAAGAEFVAWDAAKVAVPFTKDALIASAKAGAGIGAGLYIGLNRENSTPAGALTATTAGIISGITKTSFNAGAMIPNTVIPFTTSNAVTQLNTQMITKGTVGWIAYTNMPTSGESWFTRPVKDTWAQWVNGEPAK